MKFIECVRFIVQIFILSSIQNYVLLFVSIDIFVLFVVLVQLRQMLFGDYNCNCNKCYKLTLAFHSRNQYRYTLITYKSSKQASSDYLKPIFYFFINNYYCFHVFSQLVAYNYNYILLTGMVVPFIEGRQWGVFYIFQGNKCSISGYNTSCHQSGYFYQFRYIKIPKIQ